MTEDKDSKLIEQLTDADPPPSFPRERVRARILTTLDAAECDTGVAAVARRALLWRAAALAAAALVVFVVGVEYGRSLGTSPPIPVADTVRPSAAGSPVQTVSMSIQQRGTAYLTEVAKLSETAGTLSPEQLEEARQVALAILYGAAMELVRAAPDDELADAIVRSLRARRQGDPDERLLWY